LNHCDSQGTNTPPVILTLRVFVDAETLKINYLGVEKKAQLHMTTCITLKLLKSTERQSCWRHNFTWGKETHCLPINL